MCLVIPGSFEFGPNSFMDPGPHGIFDERRQKGRVDIKQDFFAMYLASFQKIIFGLDLLSTVLRDQ